MDHDLFRKHQIRTLKTVLKEDVEYHGKDYFKELYFVPNNLSQVSMEDVDLSTLFLGKKLQFPITVGSLVGGSKKFIKINDRISEFCAEFQIGQGIGDQIHCVQPEVSEDAMKSYKIVREKNPNGLILANLSAKYLTETYSYLEDVQEAINIIQADGIEIYVDPLIDLLWGYNTPGSKGFLERLKTIVETIDKPVIVKSLCTGFSNEDIRTLWDCGVSAINIEGVGGTSFPRIDTLEHLTLAQKQHEFAIKRPYDFFGTPTVWSLLDIALRKENKDCPLICGGGIRDGRQAIKAIALGADLVSLSYPVLIEIMEDFGYPDEDNLTRWFEEFLYEMKITMVVLGAKNIAELRQLARNRVVILGRTKSWLEGRKIAFPPKFIREMSHYQEDQSSENN